jgi:molybdate transport system permease protein
MGLAGGMAMRSGLFRVGLIISLGIATTVVLALLVSQVAYVDPTSVAAAMSSPDVRSAILLSLLTSSTAAVLALLVAVPSAYLLARHEFPGKSFVDALLDVPVIMSPVALGLALLLVFRTAPGVLIETHLLRFVFEVPGIVLAQFILALALETRVLKATFEEISPRLEQVARCMGCSQGRAFLHVTFPLARPGLIAALVLGWARAIGDFGATVMIAGAVPGKTETVPAAIYLGLASLRIEHSVVLTLLLTMVALSALLLLRWVGARR